MYTFRYSTGISTGIQWRLCSTTKTHVNQCNAWTLSGPLYLFLFPFYLLSDKTKAIQELSWKHEAKESYICIIFFAFGFEMTTPISLNKLMMSSWSITPDQRRNTQSYKHILVQLVLLFPAKHQVMPVWTAAVWYTINNAASQLSPVWPWKANLMVWKWTSLES